MPDPTNTGLAIRGFAEAALAVFRLMRTAFGRHGVEVLDWIRCDGENVRSLAFTERPDAWGGAP